MVDSWH